jgi:hypothetical protein
VDRRRLADVRAGTAGKPESGGSGYVVSPRLVLTCRHVVLDGHGRQWPRLEVWLGHPGDGPRRRVAAAVAWVHPERDAALLRVEGEPLAGGTLVRWGLFVGPDPVPYTGLGYPQFADYESGRGVEQLAGMLPPLGAGADGGYVLDQGAAPEAVAGRAWPGVSGAAVFCEGLLAAVVTRDDQAFGNRRLHAVPAAVLAADPEFTRLVAEDTGMTLAFEAVELAGFLQPPTSPLLARTPGSLLAAPMEAVEFTGREAELTELAAWRDSGDGLSVMLVAGEGGSGKTRLARQFTARTRQAGWAAGFLPARAVAGPLGDAGSQLTSTVELARRVCVATRPVLLVADYAETRPDEVSALADILASRPTAHPVRVLLLARAAGAWWANLAEALDPHLTSWISLAPLTKAGRARELAYTASVTGLARHLAALPDLPAGQPPVQPWDVLAAQLATSPPALDDPQLGNALTLQITALADLLDTAAGQLRTQAFGEGDLVGHERGYLRRAAARRSLLSPGILSDRSDKDEAASQAWAALERALAAMIILGPCDSNKAQAIGELGSQARAADVASWLAALYPPPAEEGGLGTVQPDRLAELLLGPILIRQPRLLSEIGTLATSADDGYSALYTLIRTAAHPDYRQVGEQAASLIASQAAPFAVAAPSLAATMPESTPIRDGLLRLGQQDPHAFQQYAFAAIGQLPHLSVSGASFNAALTQVMTGILRQLAETNPDAYLPDLAISLNHLSSRLAGVGQRQAALAAAQEAADTFRQLAETNPDAYLPGLAGSSINIAIRLAEVGQREAALVPAREAADAFRQLAETNDAYRPDLAMSLDTLGSRLAGVGQREAALVPAQEAVGIRRQLAETNPDAYLPDLAGAVSNLGSWLAEVGERQAALAAAQEAADTFRQLAETNPDAYLPGLAASLSNLGVRLAEVGQRGAALVPALEAVGIRHQLAQANPDAYLPDLAISLNNIGSLLASVGHPEAALVPALEAVGIRRQLAQANPDAYLPDLAKSLNNIAGLLAGVGRGEPALKAAQEAADTCRQLAQANPDAYLPNLAWSLDNLGTRLAEMGQRQAALAPAQEAVSIRRQLTQANPDAYLPDLAGSLNNIAIHLAATGQLDAALAPAQEAADICRQLAQANPDAYLPDLARSLNNLGVTLAEMGQRQAALAPAQEAVSIRRQLAQANPDAYLPDLTVSLNNLSNRLTEAGCDAEGGTAWETAIAGMPHESSRLALSVAHASYLLSRPDHGPGVELLVKVLNTPGLPSRVEVSARKLLRGHWRQDPNAVENAWKSLTTIPVPGWMHLSDDDITTAISWISASTWAESRQYYAEHATHLLDATTSTAIDELALLAPADLIDQHRRLLDAIREHGPDAAYQPLLTNEPPIA